MKNIVILIVLAILASACKNQPMTKAKETHLKIIETTDVHGAIFPKDLLYQNKRKGSLAQVFTFVKEQRAIPNQEVIFVDNGDILQGDPTVYYYNFEVQDSVHLLSQVMNYMGYDAATVGNHDIEAGHEVYDKFRKELDFEWMAANAIKDVDSTPYFTPYVLIERQGIKIAILGLITPAIPNWLPHNIWAGMHFEDMIKSAKYWVAYIQKNENPDVMIGLFHSGLNASYGGANPMANKNENAALLVAQQVAGFDVIFAGHDHQVNNLVVKNPSGDSTLVIDPAAHANNVGVADLHLILNETTGKYDVKKEGFVQSMEEISADTTFLYKFNLQHHAVEKYVNRPVGVLKNNINAVDALFGPSEFVDLVHKVQLEISGADVSLASPFSISAHIDSGQLFVRDMFKLYRYENYLYTISMTGQEIKDALEFSYGLWLNTMKTSQDQLLLCQYDDNGKLIKSSNGGFRLQNPFYNFDSGAGIIYKVDVTKNVGSRIIIQSMADRSPFNLQKTYKVALNSYRGNGGGSILTKGAGIPKEELASRLIHSSDVDFRLLFMRWIEARKYIKAERLNQWEIIPKEWAEKGKIKFLMGKE